MADVQVGEQIMVGDVVVPGIFESIEAEDSTQVDQVEIQGQSKKSNQRTAYSPTIIRVNLNLINDDGGTVLDKLATIRKLYRPSASVTVPQTYRLICDEAQAHGVDQVTFSGIRSRDTNLDEGIYVSLEFEEYVEISVSVVERPVSNSTTYTVVAGDTLGALAVKFGTTVQALANANNIHDVNLIYVGQQLVISSPGDSGGSSISAGGSSTSGGSDSASWTDTDIGTSLDDDTPPIVDYSQFLPAFYRR